MKFFEFLKPLFAQEHGTISTQNFRDSYIISVFSKSAKGREKAFRYIADFNAEKGREDMQFNNEIPTNTRNEIVRVLFKNAAQNSQSINEFLSGLSRVLNTQRTEEFTPT